MWAKYAASDAAANGAVAAVDGAAAAAAAVQVDGC